MARARPWLRHGASHGGDGEGAGLRAAPTVAREAPSARGIAGQEGNPVAEYAAPPPACDARDQGPEERPPMADKIGDPGAGGAAGEGNADLCATGSAESAPAIAACGTYSAHLAARLDGLEVPFRGRRSEPRAPHHAGGPRPVVVRLAPGTMLRYRTEASKRGESAVRLAQYRGASTVGEYFDRHPGPGGLARADLAHDLK